MKYLFIIIITMFYSACNMSQCKPEKITIQHMKDSAHFSNKQLAYIKKNNTIKFYNYKGKLEKEINLITGIEKRYNITEEIIEHYTNYKYILDMGAGHFCYPDAYIVPKGTQLGSGEETGIVVSALDKTIQLPKNNLGYPIKFKFNDTGQIITHDENKMEYDNLGRLLSNKFYSNKKIHKSVKYIYENSHLKKSIHEGQKDDDNYIKEYTFNSSDQLSQVTIKSNNIIKSITYFNFENTLLKSKRTYTKYEGYIILEVIDFSYENGKLISEMKYKTRPNREVALPSSNNDNDLFNLFNYKENSNFIKLTEYYYQQSNLSTITHSEYNKISKNFIEKSKISYKYNDKGQLIEAQDSAGKAFKLFSYNNN